jgi:uncharacterized protein (DUF736 family)
MGGLQTRKGDYIMAIIGKFTKHEDGNFTGKICTLTINRFVDFEPVTKKSEKAPEYRVLSEGFEIGAAWKRDGDNGEAHLSVRLDDPSYAAPINCRLVKSGVEHGFSLIWERDRKRS